MAVGIADATIERTLTCGATLEMPVGNMPYGDRQGGIRDSRGKGRTRWYQSYRVEWVQLLRSCLAQAQPQPEPERGRTGGPVGPRGAV